MRDLPGQPALPALARRSANSGCATRRCERTGSSSGRRCRCRSSTAAGRRSRAGSTGTCRWRRGRAPLKNGVQMMESEGVIATLFYRIVNDPRLARGLSRAGVLRAVPRRRPPADALRVSGPQAVITPAENVYLKLFDVMHRVVLVGRVAGHRTRVGLRQAVSGRSGSHLRRVPRRDTGVTVDREAAARHGEPGYLAGLRERLAAGDVTLDREPRTCDLDGRAVDDVRPGRLPVLRRALVVHLRSQCGRRARPAGGPRRLTVSWPPPSSRHATRADTSRAWTTWLPFPASRRNCSRASGRWRRRCRRA